MVIVLDWDDDVQRYLAEFGDLVFPQPSVCPQCTTPGRVIGHGSYGRTVTEPSRTIPIRVKRLLCTACRHTLSLLPSFCLPWRHYATATIQAVLHLRVAAQTSWRAIGTRFAPADLPTRTTCREWVAAFTEASRSYLPAFVRQLARWPVGAIPLEVVLADLATVPPGPAQLIAAVPHLVAWLGDHGVAVGSGRRGWLAAVWQWGNGATFGRLI
jgi:hypothetical protein